MSGEHSDGTLVVVVGPSGAGKDSVINFALDRLSGLAVHRVRRVITRAGEAGGEDHEAISPGGFEARLAQGGFAVSWSAHGLSYGIPADTLVRLRQGQILIANGSRHALDHFRAKFARIRIVNIVASPEVLAKRLVTRGRESEQEILARLQRRVPDLLDEPDVITIDNSGSIEIAGERLAALVAELRQPVL
ncbi:ribose 1,5-bisphosphokinase [Pararhizobium capsulatum DSM 1112]|uniref:Ribose 1,5-bisphosphate phosphokinase PhnN n=1 Tax=Pararhizobium capsulatum DSM 1112 TaxID=1121113 RepID=A0ABU0BIK2_9HYPH|nr:phosphonate metabolism protein/1,5-bisphosphokinase (PRPP-forming) PhnN [Pararhizobium capsulatum]MDQ0318085.1 ribose 1,5-bisphosphokinase [Pararhizobium capsulatum DSM 1112]